jgi:hypothetical protein
MHRCCWFALAASLALALSPLPALAGVIVGGSGVFAGPGAKVELEPQIDPAGDPDGSGDVRLRLDPRRGTVCFAIEVHRLDPIVAVHIHAGAAGSSNEDLLLVDLDFPNEGLQGCVKAGRHLIESILEDIDDRDEQFYLHVHTSDFSTGAVRGQIERP